MPQSLPLERLVVGARWRARAVRVAAAGAVAATVLSAAVFTAASPAPQAALTSLVAGTAGRALAVVAEQAALPETEPVSAALPAPASRPRRTDRGWLIDAPPSPRPQTAQFQQHGQRIALDRDPQDQCQAWRLREWVQLRCGSWQTSAAQLAGSHKGVRIWMDQIDHSADEEPDKRVGVFVFPVRPGDLRMFQLTGESSRYGSVDGIVIQQSWHAGHEPRIVVTPAA